MIDIFFISDLHFGHKAIKHFSGDLRSGSTYEENMENIIANWNNKVRARDIVYVLGDVAFSKEGFDNLSLLRGQKRLIRGNHDNKFTTEEYLPVFKSVDGFLKYKEFWLSHAPIHPAELRGKKNIHGHVHGQSIKNGDGSYDERYINVCCEAVGDTPISLDEIRHFYNDIRRC